MSTRENSIAGPPAKPTVDSEAEAIRLAKSGDSAGFEFLYSLHRRRVYALCLRMSANPTEAEDLTQDTFLQVFRKVKSFRGDSGFSTWLHRVAINVVLMRFRKKKRAEISLDEPQETSEGGRGINPDPGQDDLRLAGALDRVALQRALDRLPHGYKQMFMLHDVQGYEHHEIASILGCSVGNSKSQLHKARLRMRGLLLEQTSPQPAAKSIIRTEVPLKGDTTPHAPASSQQPDLARKATDKKRKLRIDGFMLIPAKA